VSYRDTARADYLVAGADNGETVSLTCVRGSTTTTLTVASAEPRDLTNREIQASGGYFEHGDREWMFGAAQLTGGITPKRGDRLTDAAGVIWYLREGCRLDPLGAVWNCPSSRKAGS
jgi:hypothetical protein